MLYRFVKLLLFRFESLLSGENMPKSLINILTTDNHQRTPSSAVGGISKQKKELARRRPQDQRNIWLWTGSEFAFSM